jgi:hypothetical protein
MKRRLLIALGTVLGMLGTVAAAWPLWADSIARDKMLSILDRKFDEVELGGFELERDHAVISDLIATKDGAVVRFEEVVVDFELGWDLNVKVLATNFEGGSAIGDVDAFRSLRGQRDPSTSSSGRLDVSKATIDVKDFALHLDLGDERHLDVGSMATEAGTIKGPFAFTLRDVEGQDSNVQGSADSLHTVLYREKPFPLEVEVFGAEANLDKVAIKDVNGVVGLDDPEFTNLNFDLEGQTTTGQSWSFEGHVDRENRSVKASMTADKIRPIQLPGARDFPIDPERGLVSIDLEVRVEGDVFSAQGDAHVRDLHLIHKRVAKHPVVFGLDALLDVRADLSSRELLLKKFEVVPYVGDQKTTLSVAAEGRVLYAADPKQREYEMRMKMAASPCQEVLAAVPPGLVPGLQGFELGGTTELNFHTIVKMHDHEATVLEGGLDLDKCTIEKMPPVVEQMDAQFRHLIQMKNGRMAQKMIGEGMPGYVKFDDMNSALPGAVLSTEDGGFWRHKGFRVAAFRESLQRNIELGEVRRGASTLTMQMVKNVLLSHERTISRKLQEMFLTWVVERTLSKKRILELYLNVVEFGPGIYGVMDACDHYFNKHPRDVTSKEAAFLATLLPRPIQRHGMWCRGQLTPNHQKYVDKIHKRMLAFERISQEMYDYGESQPILFSRMGWTDEKSCLEYDKTFDQGHVQEALSGLLGSQ